MTHATVTVPRMKKRRRHGGFDADFSEQDLREIISTIPDIADRVFLLIMMRDHAGQLREFATAILYPWDKHHDEVVRGKRSGK